MASPSATILSYLSIAWDGDLGPVLTVLWRAVVLSPVLDLKVPNKLLGYITRNAGFIRSTDVRRSVYLTLFRPLFGYATQIWAPQSIELITRIERTQRRATKYILKLPFSCTTSYMHRLKTLDLLPLTFWHKYLDMVFFFKIIHGLLSVKPSIDLFTDTAAILN